MTDRRTRKREARREHILDVALELVLSEGLEALTTHRLARQLDVAVGGLYRYFPSKQALIAAVELLVVEGYRRDLALALEHARAYVGRRDDPPALLFPLLVAASTYQRLATAEPGRFRLINLLLAEPGHVLDPTQAAEVVGALHQLLALVVPPLQAATHAGVLSAGEPTTRALIFWASLRGVLQILKLRTFDPQLVDPMRLIPATIDTLLGGFGASADHIRAARDLLDRWPDVAPASPPETT